MRRPSSAISLAALSLVLSCAQPPETFTGSQKKAAQSDDQEGDTPGPDKPVNTDDPKQTDPDDPVTDPGSPDPVVQEPVMPGEPGEPGEPSDPGDPITPPEGGNLTLPPFCATAKAAGDWKSARASFNAQGKLEYAADAEKNRIVDYSYAGYRYGLVDIPVYPVVTTLGPVSGDNTKSIQDALDAIGKRTPDAKGIRGALLLKPGKYQVLGTLRVNASGVVLRGSGFGADPSKDTIISAEKNAPAQRTVIVLGNGKSGNFKGSGTAVEITDAFVQVGSLSFTVKDASSFKVGDAIQIKHPSSQAWINALGGGGPIKEPHWTPGSTDILYNRKITAKSGNTLTLDAPVYNHLDKKLTTSTISKMAGQTLVSESGVENLRVDIQTAGGEDENHAWDAIGVQGAQDSWVKGITALHFGQAGVVASDSIRITVDDARAIQPVGIRTGGRFYNFNVYSMGQLILFKNCHAEDGRHNFISNGVQTASGIVWHKCTSTGASASEGHRRWSHGMLFDSITEKSGAINLFNRGDMGTSHGWGAAHSTVWNYNGNSILQKPPTAQNYFISNAGKITDRGDETRGFVEIKSGKMSPSSLYEAQLCERLGSK